MKKRLLFMIKSVIAGAVAMAVVSLVQMQLHLSLKDKVK